MNRMMISAGLAALLAACGAPDVADTGEPPLEAETPPPVEASDADASEVAETVKLYTLDCGELEADQTPFGSEGEYEGQMAIWSGMRACRTRFHCCQMVRRSRAGG